MGFEPAADKRGGFRAVVARESGDKPVFGEENVTGALDFLQLIESGHKVVQGFVLPERMIQQTQAFLHPGLRGAVFGFKQRSEHGIAYSLVRGEGGPNEVEACQPVGPGNPAPLDRMDLLQIGRPAQGQLTGERVVVFGRELQPWPGALRAPDLPECFAGSVSR